MALVIKSALNLYDYLFTTLKGDEKSFEVQIIIKFSSDPRSVNYVMIKDSPLPVLTILAGYTVLCKYGPVFMENRKPVELRSIMTLYNFIQVIANAICGVCVRLKISPEMFYSVLSVFCRQFIICLSKTSSTFIVHRSTLATANMV